MESQVGSQTARRRTNLLLVDDSPDMLDLLAMRFRALGLSVVGASSGKTAIALLGETRPDMVVTDFNMPEMNGLDLIDEIRRILPTVPVVVATVDDMFDRRRAFQRGAIACYCKSHDFALLGNFVWAFLNLLAAWPNSGVWLGRAPMTSPPPGP